MRIGILAAISLLFLSAQSVSADTITGCVTDTGQLKKVQVGDQPVKPCGNKETELSWNQQGSTFVLMDSDPAGSKEIGTVVSVSVNLTRRVLTLVNYQDSNGAVRNIGLQASSPGMLGYESIEFDEFGCSGNAYLNGLAPQAHFPTAFDASAIIREHDNPNTLALWVSTDAGPRDVEIKSSLSADGEGCHDRPQPFIQSVIPAELLDGDLHKTFPPPYTLHIR